MLFLKDARFDLPRELSNELLSFHFALKETFCSEITFEDFSLFLGLGAYDFSRLQIELTNHFFSIFIHQSLEQLEQIYVK